MFRSSRDYRTFLTVLMTYTLDLVGFSIVFPVLAPLLLNTQLHFFAADAADGMRTTVLGLLFAVFGIAQFIGALMTGALADHYGRYRVFLGSIGLNVFGYALMAIGVYLQSLSWLFLGRSVTGLCSGNLALAQSAVADLTDPHHRSKAFGILLGVGGLGFVAGPWIGGKLANPSWLSGSGAFIFAAIASLLNFWMVFFFFVEKWTHRARHAGANFMRTFKDISLVFHQKRLRFILTTYLIFSVGWAFFLIFSSTFLVQRFSLGADMIGDMFAYMALVWFFVSMFLNKELSGKLSLRSLILTGLLVGSIGEGFFIYPDRLWLYWIIIPVALLGGALSWVNLGAMLSVNASEEMQGRVMGVGGAMWSIGQIIAPLVAGPLAGWNLYSPIMLGSLLVLIAFFYFLCCDKRVSIPRRGGSSRKSLSDKKEGHYS